MATTPSRPSVIITTPSRQSVVMATTPSRQSVTMKTIPSLPLISSGQLLLDSAMAQGASFFPARNEAIKSAIYKHRFERIGAKIQAARAFCGPQAAAAPRYVWKGTESAVTNVAVWDGESPGHETSEKTLLRVPKVKGRKNLNQPTAAEIQIYKDTSYQCCDVLGDKTCSKCQRYNYRKQHVRGWGKKFRFAQQTVRINHLLPELSVGEIREKLDFQEFSIASFVEREEKRKAKLAMNPNISSGRFLSSQAGRTSPRSRPMSSHIGYDGASFPGDHVTDRGADDSVQLVVPNIIGDWESKGESEIFKSRKRTRGQESKTLDTEEESNDDKNAFEEADNGMETNLGTSQEESGTESRNPFRIRRPRSTLLTDYVPIKWHYPPHVIPNIDPPLVDSHCLVDARFYAGKGK
ncbi:uncharacterized protein LOC144925291 [Branchiostoma floridae x Branchiostoma belcheri]